jgi:hypothetical protein
VNAGDGAADGSTAAPPPQAASGRNREYISIWASEEKLLRGRSAYQCYSDFMRAFATAFEQVCACVRACVRACSTPLNAVWVAQPHRCCAWGWGALAGAAETLQTLGRHTKRPCQCHALTPVIRPAAATLAQDLGSNIVEVVVGAGPCGELRYPVRLARAGGLPASRRNTHTV